MSRSEYVLYLYIMIMKYFSFGQVKALVWISVVYTMKHPFYDTMLACFLMATWEMFVNPVKSFVGWVQKDMITLVCNVSSFILLIVQ